jgi:hypothetical protein
VSSDGTRCELNVEVESTHCDWFLKSLISMLWLNRAVST